MATDNRGFSGKLADPDFRRERAVKGARTRTSLDHHVQKVVDSAPSLTAEQRSRLATLLRPSDSGRDADAA